MCTEGDHTRLSSPGPSDEIVVSGTSDVLFAMQYMTQINVFDNFAEGFYIAIPTSSCFNCNVLFA